MRHNEQETAYFIVFSWPIKTNYKGEYTLT